jgi:ornithine cyclodeaminase/alanine dehydrogenase-like protein (mu-crystallin family)
MTIFINEKHIEEMHESGLVSMGDYIDAVEAAYGDQGSGEFEILPRTNFWIDVPGRKRRGSLKVAGAALKGVGVMGASLYSGGYGGMNLWVTLYDAKTGKVPAILHGHIIGKMKTGATSAMAAKHMARADAQVVGMLGSATQARTQLLGLAAVRDLKELRVFSPKTAKPSPPGPGKQSPGSPRGRWTARKTRSATSIFWSPSPMPKNPYWKPVGFRPAHIAASSAPITWTRARLMARP